MEEIVKEKKIRWSVAKHIDIVAKALRNSKLKISKTQQYSKAMERLNGYFKATDIQTWILSLSLYINFGCENDNPSFNKFTQWVSCSPMEIITWKKEINSLISRGLLEWNRYEKDFLPCAMLREGVINNTELTASENITYDDIRFIKDFGQQFDNREDRDMSQTRNYLFLAAFERSHKNLPLVKRAQKALTDKYHRFFLYDCCSDLIQGNNTSLNSTLSNLYDDPERLNISKSMMEETHPLFTGGYLTFETKGNLNEAIVELTPKGKKLLLDDKAFLFEDKISEKQMIDVTSIKEKQLFYSPENQLQIETLTSALDEDKFTDIQTRLKESGLPCGVAALFYGAPGTGKTETVYQLAKKTGRSIVHVDISECKSAWFGESEKHIKKIFTNYRNACEFSRNKGEKIPILLFNEADAIISKRKDAASGNVAQTENAMQNILLEEMENLDGVMIATTNLATNLDAAFERRFLFKIKFENPTVEAKKKIWQSKLDWLPEDALDTFASAYEFSGGQIDNIVRKVTMAQVISGSLPSVDEIRQFCNTEKLGDTGQQIGFSI